MHKPRGKKFALIIVFLTVIVTSWSITDVRADGWFDRYGEVAWKEERIMHLDNLAIFLKRNPEMIGYFGYYSGRKKDQAKVKRRVKKDAERYKCK